MLCTRVFIKTKPVDINTSPMLKSGNIFKEYRLTDMTWLLILYIPAIYGLSFSEVYDFQINAIKPHLISFNNAGGFINVTVKYEYDSFVFEAQPLWWVNGKVITDGERGFRVKHLEVGRLDLDNSQVSTSSINPPDKFLHKTSILIPSTFRVTSLQIQIVSNLYDVIMDVNLLPLPTGKTLIEFLPQHKMTIAPRYTIRYVRDDSLQIRISFTSENLRNLARNDVTAELIGLDTCINPAKSERRSSVKDKTLTVWKPTRNDDLSFREMYRLNNADFVVKRLNITFDTDDVLPKGILKISSGYKSRSSCFILSGVKVTMSSFLQPGEGIGMLPFFPENKVAFLKTQRSYYVNYGNDVDIIVSAIGGHLSEDQFNDIIPTHPSVWLEKLGNRVVTLAEINRLFEREIIVRLKDVTEHDSGHYTAYAQLGSAIAQLDIYVYVTNIPSICGR